MPERVDARLVVLSSCEGAADGSEALGLGAVLLARGAASVRASLTVVRDLECAEFVAEVHDELAIGEAVADAAANVRRRWLTEDDLSRRRSHRRPHASAVVHRRSRPVEADQDGPSRSALIGKPSCPGRDRVERVARDR